MRMTVTRRGMFKTALAAVVAGVGWPRLPAAAVAEELRVPDNVPTEKFDFGSGCGRRPTRSRHSTISPFAAGGEAGSPANQPRRRRRRRSHLRVALSADGDDSRLRDEPVGGIALGGVGRVALYAGDPDVVVLTDRMIRRAAPPFRFRFWGER